MDGRGRALGLIRRDVFGGRGVDIHQVADRFGYRVVWTIYLDTGPLVSWLILAGAVMEHEARPWWCRGWSTPTRCVMS